VFTPTLFALELHLFVITHVEVAYLSMLCCGKKELIAMSYSRAQQETPEEEYSQSFDDGVLLCPLCYDSRDMFITNFDRQPVQVIRL
jgi:hypothetical protein